MKNRVNLEAIIRNSKKLVYLMIYKKYECKRNKILMSYYINMFIYKGCKST